MLLIFNISNITICERTVEEDYLENVPTTARGIITQFGAFDVIVNEYR